MKKKITRKANKMEKLKKEPASNAWNWQIFFFLYYDTRQLILVLPLLKKKKKKKS